MISFGAKYISSVNIQKVNHDNNVSKPCKVSFVELNPANENDVDAIGDVAENWDTFWNYSELIHNRMEYYSKYEDKLEGNKFYAITTQSEHLESLESSKILAVGQICEDDNDVMLKYLEVKPDGVELTKKPYVYNHVGSGMLDMLKGIFTGKKIELFPSSDGAAEFYKANDFKESEDIKSRMYYMA